MSTSQENLLYLKPTAVIDSDHQSIKDFASGIIGAHSDPVKMAVMLYLAVRDGIRYDPYTPFHLAEYFRASNVLRRGRGFCVPKASLLCALGRACGIPSRIGFATVRNHLATRQLIAFLGTDLFVYHAFVELYLEGRWVKATPAFNIELCQRHRVPPLEFSGREDSLFQPYNLEAKKFMEYVEFHGVEADIPVDRLVEAWTRVYGENRVRAWIKRFEETGGQSLSDFDREEIMRGEAFD
jgi:transglutaminase-like putative cysteine protease